MRGGPTVPPRTVAMTAYQRPSGQAVLVPGRASHAMAWLLSRLIFRRVLAGHLGDFVR